MAFVRPDQAMAYEEYKNEEQENFRSSQKCGKRLWLSMRKRNRTDDAISRKEKTEYLTGKGVSHRSGEIAGMWEYSFFYTLFSRFYLNDFSY